MSQSVTLDQLRDEANAEDAFPSLEVKLGDDRAVTFRHPFHLTEVEREVAREYVEDLTDLAGPEAKTAEAMTLQDLERVSRALLICVADDVEAAHTLVDPLPMSVLFTLTKTYTKVTRLGEASPSPS